MRTLHYPDFDQLQVCDRPSPEAGPGEVLVRVSAVGVCGSELETFKAKSPRRPPPLIMGHEFCGIVQAVGAGVTAFRAGQNVVSNSVVSCGTCRRCTRGDTHLCAKRQLFGMHRPGAFAEFVPVPAGSLVAWPAGLPAAQACLAEPLANGVHMVELVRNVSPQSVLVIGAGPIGLLALLSFRALLGCRVFVADLSPERLAIAERLGAAKIIRADKEDATRVVADATDGEGADVVIDAVGSGRTKAQSLQAARPGGSVVWIGLHENKITFDSYDITTQERKVMGTYAATTRDLEAALGLMASGKIDVSSWIKSYPLEAGVDAFRRQLDPKSADIKAILTIG